MGDDATVDTKIVRDGQPDRGKETGGDDADAGKPDARPDGDGGIKEGGGDAPKDSFTETGSPCSPLNAIQTRQCGYCGQQYRVCLDPEDSGVTTWQEWGVCLNEVDGGCMPGDTMDASCGKCGNVALTCTKTCTWPTGGSCKNQGPCWPGDQDFVLGLSCDDDGLGRERECNSSCEWEPFGACETPTTGIVLSTTVGGRVGRRVTLQTMPQIGYSDVYPNEGTTCGDTYFNQWSSYSYAFVELRNPASTDATVSVWTYPATGSSALPNPYYVEIRALHAIPNIPPGGVDGGGYGGEGLQDCVVDWVSGCCMDTTTDPSACPTASSCFTWSTPYWGGLMAGEGHAVTIPANSSVWLFIQNLFEWPTTGGDIMIGVKTHSI